MMFRFKMASVLVLALALVSGASAQSYAWVQGVTFDNGNNPGQLRFFEDWGNGGHYLAFEAPASLAATVVWTLPGTDGTSGQALITNGAGVLGWGGAGGGSSASGADWQIQLSDGSGVFKNLANFYHNGDSLYLPRTASTPTTEGAEVYWFGGTSGADYVTDVSGMNFRVITNSAGGVLQLVNVGAGDLDLLVDGDYRLSDSGANSRRAVWADGSDKFHVGLEDAVGAGNIVLHTKGVALELPTTLVPPDASGNNFFKFSSSGVGTWDAIAAVDVQNTLSTLTPRGVLNFGSTLLATDQLTRTDVGIDPAGITAYIRAQLMGGGVRGKFGGAGGDSDDVGAGLDSGGAYNRTPFRRAFLREYVQTPSHVWSVATTDIGVTAAYWRAAISGTSPNFTLNWERNGSSFAAWDSDSFDFYKELSVSGGGDLWHTSATGDAGTVLETRMQQQATVNSGDAFQIASSGGTAYIKAGLNSGGSGGGLLTVENGGFNIVALRSLPSAATRGVYVDSAGGSLERVVGPREAAVADAGATVGSVQTQLNALLARLRTHGLIAP